MPIEVDGGRSGRNFAGPSHLGCFPQVDIERSVQQARAPPCRVSGQPRVPASEEVCRQPGSVRPGNSGCGGNPPEGSEHGPRGPPREMIEDCLDHHRSVDAPNAVQGCTNAARAGCAGAATLTAPPQCVQVSMSILNTRFSRCAHVIETWRAGGGSPVTSVLRRPRLAGVTCSRSRWFGANTP